MPRARPLSDSALPAAVAGDRWEGGEARVLLTKAFPFCGKGVKSLGWPLKHYLALSGRTCSGSMSAEQHRRYARGEIGLCGLACDVAASEPHCIILEHCCSGRNGRAHSRCQTADSQMNFWKPTLCQQGCLSAGSHGGEKARPPPPGPQVVIWCGCCSPVLRLAI